MKIVIGEKERGLLYKDGKLEQWLEPGAHSVWSLLSELRVERLNIEQPCTALTPELDAVVPEKAATRLVVKGDEVAIVSVDGRATNFLEPGRYLLWQLRGEVKAEVFGVKSLRAELNERQAKVVPAGLLLVSVIADNQRGLLTVDGKATEWLEPGKHYFWQRERTLAVQVYSMDGHFAGSTPELRRLVPAQTATQVEIPARHVAVIKRDGVPVSGALPGQYLLWQTRAKIEAELHSLEPLFTTIPEAQWALFGQHLLRPTKVDNWERGLLYVNGKLEQVLEPGRYGLQVDGRDVQVASVDMREQEVQITGQEVMTADKVTLRINLVVKYQIVDPVLCATQQANPGGALYTEAQMAARRYIAGSSVDRLLESRNDASQIMTDSVQARAQAWGVKVLQIDLKDVILPGEMKSLLNQVIEAEKRAAANLIMRREETAATRSQANTARMMESNPTLLRLKELETIKEIAGSVQNLTIVAGADNLAALKLDK